MPYIIEDSERADGTQSDVLYASVDESLGHASIIIQVQYSVSFAFVHRSIRYYTLIHQKFKTLTVLVVYCISKTSAISIKLTSSSTLPYAMDVHCRFTDRIFSMPCCAC